MDTIPNIVNIVLWLLALLSVLTWAIMILKAYEFWKNTRNNRILLAAFSKVSHVRELQSILTIPSGTLAHICSAGIDELQSQERSQTTVLDSKDRREMMHHALRQQLHLEQSRLENGLAVLASVGSTAPFIGLFGTVWGIMHALKSISATGSAGLDVVAGPIGEALIATAMGIATAIPAVLAYNYFLRRVRRSITNMDHFADCFLHLVIKSGIRGN
ncbi:MAG: MotA/TolQ/ExbB proton channel family protein [Pseudomonadota bacterium]